jgi:hypothetical protein
MKNNNITFNDNFNHSSNKIYISNINSSNLSSFNGDIFENKVFSNISNKNKLIIKSMDDVNKNEYYQNDVCTYKIIPDLEYKKHIDEINNKYYDVFISSCMHDSSFEFYFYPEDLLYKIGFEYSNELLIKWLGSIYERSKEKTDVKKWILYFISNCNYDVFKEDGFLIALNGLNDNNNETRSVAISCLDSWNNKKLLPLLSKVNKKVKDQWLKKYIENIINRLKKA